MCEDTQGKTALKFPNYRISLSLLCIEKYNITLYLRLKAKEYPYVMKTALLLYSFVQDP